MSSTSPDVRGQLVMGAADLIGRRGLRGATVRDLAWHSGTPEGSTYHYFPGGKQELAAAAVRVIGEQVSHQMSTGCEEAGPVQGLRVFVEIARQLMLSTDCQGGCPVLAVAVEGPDGYTVAPALDAAAEAFDSWTSVLADSLIRHGIGEHEAKQVGTLVVAALEGAIALCRAKGHIGPINEVVEPLESLVGSLVGRQRDDHHQGPAKVNGQVLQGS